MYTNNCSTIYMKLYANKRIKYSNDVTYSYMASIHILNNLNFKHGQDVHLKNADMHCKNHVYAST